LFGPLSKKIADQHQAPLDVRRIGPALIYMNSWRRMIAGTPLAREDQSAGVVHLLASDIFNLAVSAPFRDDWFCQQRRIRSATT